LPVNGARVLILGLTFKENCPDLRNTRVVDVVKELESYDVNVDVHDPWVDADEARAEYGIDLVESPKTGEYDAIVVAVAHDEFRKRGVEGIRSFGKSDHVLYDLKYLFGQDESDLRL